MKDHLLLFFDDKNILSRNGLVRKLGRPKIVGHYQDPRAVTANGLPSVWHDQKNKVYHLFYNGHIKGRTVALAAISHDGVRFEPRNTADQSSIQGAAADNQFLNASGELAYVYTDHTCAESERLKALHVYGDRETQRIIQDPLYTSGDGIHWTRQPVQWHNRAAEPGAMCFYNHVTGKHSIMARPDAGVRRVGLIETDDFKSFSDIRLVMTPDSMDEELAEHYGMPIFPYENYFVGFLWIFHAPNIRSRKYYGGNVNSELVYSYNGTNFNRTLRKPFFRNQDSVKTAGMVFPCHMYTAEGDRLIVVASASKNEHGNFAEEGSIVIYEIRKDGFLSLHANDEGDMITIPMLYQGGEIRINLIAKDATCALYTDDSDREPMNLLTHQLIPLKEFSHEKCEHFSGDSLEWTPRWENADPNTLKEKIIYIEIKLNAGDIFSVRGKLTPMMICDLARYHLHGIVPDVTGIG